MCVCMSMLVIYSHTRTVVLQIFFFFFAVFSGSVLALPLAMSANAITLKEELLFTWIIIRILCASSQRNGPSGFDPSSLTQSLLFSVCLSDVPQTSTMWQNNAFYRQQSSSPATAHYNLWRAVDGPHWSGLLSLNEERSQSICAHIQLFQLHFTSYRGFTVCIFLDLILCLVFLSYIVDYVWISLCTCWRKHFKPQQVPF